MRNQEIDKERGDFEKLKERLKFQIELFLIFLPIMFIIHLIKHGQ